MLIRHTRLYSSSCSQVALVYLYSFKGKREDQKTAL